MLKPAKMERIRLVFSKKYYAKALTLLHDMGAMQIEYMPEDAAKMLSKGDSETYAHLGSYAQRFRALESLLYREDSSKRYSFGSMKELTDKADSVVIDSRVAAIRKELDSLAAEAASIANSASILRSMPPQFRHDTSILSASGVISFVVSGPQLKEFVEAAKEGLKGAAVVAGDSSALVSISRQDQSLFGKACEGLKLHVETVPAGISGSVAAELKTLDAKRAENQRRRKALEDELAVISKEYYPLVSAIREQLDIEMEKQEVTTRLGIGRSAIAVDGWVPSTKIEALRAGLRKVTDNAFVIDKVKTDALPPTKLDNPVTARLFEFFIRFYSLPRSDEFDPTLIFALAFPIFFGFMIGDVGYGVVMLLGSLWLIHRLAHPPARSRLPKALTNFVHMIISDNGLNVIARSIIPGALIAIVLGVLFNEYFGFQLPYATPFDVEVHLSTLLVISGWIGVFMVSLGFTLGFLNKFFNGENKHAAAKLGWLAAAWGFVIFGLAVLHKQPLGLANHMAVLSYALLAGGIGTVLYGEGFQSLMELPSLISHILSYTRLVGILLASVILAQVIDFIFVRGWYHSIWLGLLGTLILVVGQLFNIVIALFEPGIQGARLIYVEFFSKFFSGNGNAFRPFASKRRRTLSTFEVEAEAGKEQVPH